MRRRSRRGCKPCCATRRSCRKRVGLQGVASHRDAATRGSGRSSPMQGKTLHCATFPLGRTRQGRVAVRPVRRCPDACEKSREQERAHRDMSASRMRSRARLRACPCRARPTAFWPRRPEKWNVTSSISMSARSMRCDSGRARIFRSRIHQTAIRVRPSSVRADNATRATMRNDMADAGVSPIAFSEPLARRPPVSRARLAVRPLASRCARQRLAAASRHARVQLRHANRCTGVDVRRLAQASVRGTAKVLEHDGCALLSFAPCRACARARVRRQVARRSPPTARRALGRGVPCVAWRSRAVFDDGVAFGTLRKAYRSGPTSHISQH